MSKPAENRTPFTFFGISTSLEALRIMITELRKAADGEIENFEVNMATFGVIQRSSANPEKLVCVGCAALVTLMKLSGFRLDDFQENTALSPLGDFEARCKAKAALPETVLSLFEFAINDVRMGEMEPLLDFFRDDPRRKIMGDIYDRQMRNVGISHSEAEGMLYSCSWEAHLPRWEAFLAAVEAEVAALPAIP